MECPYCHRMFKESSADPACKGCLSRRGCQRVRCPDCGYEMPREPRSAARIRELYRRIFHRHKTPPLLQKETRHD